MEKLTFTCDSIESITTNSRNEIEITVLKPRLDSVVDELVSDAREDEDKWISLSEKQPSENQKIIVATKCGSVVFGFFKQESMSVLCSSGDWFFDFDLWMPMPSLPVM